LAGKPEADAATREAVGKAIDKEFPAFWDYLERELGDGEFFVGGRLTIADIAIASPHLNLRYAGVAPARNRWPRLRAFLDRMHCRSSFSTLVEEEAPIFDRLSARISD
jgi:glutathione S-transferase